MKVEAFVIHLERAHGRREAVDRLVKDCPVPTHVISAVDARELSADKIAAVYKKNLQKPRYTFTMTNGEVACFLSHRKVWKEIVDRGLDGGIVFEDDVELDPSIFPAALNIALQRSGSGCYVQFQVRDKHYPGNTEVLADGFRLIEPDVVPLRASSQYIDRSAALRLLDVTKEFDRPIDGIVQMRWLTGVPVFVVLPSGVSELSAALGGTTIQAKKKSLLQRLRHEIHRVAYRRAIRKLSVSK